MLRSLRLKLTLAFLAATLALILLLGGGAYIGLRRYFQSTIDLSLQHRMVGQFQLFGLPVPPELVAAEQIWLENQTGLAAANATSVVSSSSTSGEHDGGEIELEQDELLEGAYTSELAAIFVLPLNEYGQLLFDPNPYKAPINPDVGASQAALLNGNDWRYAQLSSGQRLRLLSYRTVAGAEPAVFQVGRLLVDQDRILGQLVLGISTIGALIVAIVGSVSWWLAGRTLLPAQRAWDQQQDFVANASHELRTPLTLIRASTEVAMRSNIGKKEAGLLRDVLQESDYMSRLVDDLLLLSRLDAGQLKLELEKVSLRKLFTEVQHQLEKLPQKTRASFNLADSKGQVLADFTRLRQVLLILLDNAIKHTPEGTPVRVSADHDDKQVRITVEDRGPGIAAEHLAHIFERFYQVSRGFSDESRSNGLGLSIAKGLVELHGGTIEVESELGKGTRFIVSLPT